MTEKRTHSEDKITIEPEAKDIASGLHTPTGEMMWSYNDDDMPKKIKKDAMGILDVPFEVPSDYNLSSRPHVIEENFISPIDADSGSDVTNFADDVEDAEDEIDEELKTLSFLINNKVVSEVMKKVAYEAGELPEKKNTLKAVKSTFDNLIEKDMISPSPSVYIKLDGLFRSAFSAKDPDVFFDTCMEVKKIIMPIMFDAPEDTIRGMSHLLEQLCGITKGASFKDDPYANAFVTLDNIFNSLVESGHDVDSSLEAYKDIAYKMMDDEVSNVGRASLLRRLEGEVIPKIRPALTSQQLAQLNQALSDIKNNLTKSSDKKSVPSITDWKLYSAQSPQHKALADMWMKNPAPGFASDFSSFAKWYKEKKAESGSDFDPLQAMRNVTKDRLNLASDEELEYKYKDNSVNKTEPVVKSKVTVEEPNSEPYYSQEFMTIFNIIYKLNTSGKDVRTPGEAFRELAYLFTTGEGKDTVNATKSHIRQLNSEVVDKIRPMLNGDDLRNFDRAIFVIKNKYMPNDESQNAKAEMNWANYSNVSPAHKKLAQRWVSSPPVGYSKDFQSFVKWYNLTKAWVGKDFSPQEAIGYLDNGVEPHHNQHQEQIADTPQDIMPQAEQQVGQQPQATEQASNAPAQKVALEPTDANVVESLKRLLKGMPLSTADNPGNVYDSRKVRRMTNRYIRGISGARIFAKKEDVANSIYAVAQMITQATKLGSESFAQTVYRKLQGKDAQMAQRIFDGIVWTYLQAAWSAKSGEKTFSDGKADRRMQRQQRRDQRAIERSQK